MTPGGQSDASVRFLIIPGNGYEPRSGKAMVAFLGLTNTFKNNALQERGWKATIPIPGGCRLFGNWKRTRDEAAQDTIQRFKLRISYAQRSHINKGLVDVFARFDARAARLERRHAELCAERDGPVVPDAVKYVRYVHQIYVFFSVDETEMSQLFKTSMQKWKEVADTMGVTYILWNASMLESLVRQEYPQLWDMYCDVRYPIMRCDIGRICIIHSYGGLYSDFDVFPNRSHYQQVNLAVTRVKLPPTKAMKRKGVAARATTDVPNRF